MIHLWFRTVTAVYTEFYKSQHKLCEHQQQVDENEKLK